MADISNAVSYSQIHMGHKQASNWVSKSMHFLNSRTCFWRGTKQVQFKDRECVRLLMWFCIGSQPCPIFSGDTFSWALHIVIIKRSSPVVFVNNSLEAETVWGWGQPVLSEELLGFRLKGTHLCAVSPLPALWVSPNASLLLPHHIQGKKSGWLGSDC